IKSESTFKALIPGPSPKGEKGEAPPAESSMLLPEKAFVRIVNNRLHAHPLRSSERRRMRRSKPALAALALMLLGANSYSQSETNKPRATDQSVQLGGAGSIVKGRAVFEDTGQPAPKQRVQLVAVDLLTNRRGP